MKTWVNKGLLYNFCTNLPCEHPYFSIKLMLFERLPLTFLISTMTCSRNPFNLLFLSSLFSCLIFEVWASKYLGLQKTNWGGIKQGQDFLKVTMALIAIFYFLQNQRKSRNIPWLLLLENLTFISPWIAIKVSTLKSSQLCPLFFLHG